MSETTSTLKSGAKPKRGKTRAEIDDEFEEPHPPKKGVLQDAWESGKTLIIALFIAVIFRSFAYEPFHIPSGSMKGTLLIGDYLFVSKYSYGYSRYSFPFGIDWFEGRIGSNKRPERGDVVVFRLPTNPRVDYIKRVVGLPGDRIQVRGGTLFINGNAVPREPAEPFQDDEYTDRDVFMKRFKETLPEGKAIYVLDEPGEGQLDDTQEYIVPEKHYFMMGDNRDYSQDSRVLNRVGYVPEENLVGRAEVIFFSTDGSAAWWELWKWPFSLRLERSFTAIH